MTAVIRPLASQQKEAFEKAELIKPEKRWEKVKELSDCFATELMTHTKKYTPQERSQCHVFSFALLANFYPTMLLLERVPQELSSEFKSAQAKAKFSWSEVEAKDHDAVRKMIAEQTVKKVVELMKAAFRKVVTEVDWEVNSSGSFFGFRAPDSVSITVKSKNWSMF